jgi:folate-binding protein YgfZ
MDTLDRERRAAHEGALVQPAPELGALVVTGSDRKTWLNGMVTCDLAKLEAGSGAYGLAVAKVGKIMAELWIVLARDRILIGTHRDNAAELRAHYDKHLIMEDAEVVDASGEIAWLLVHGPLAGEAAAVARKLGAEAAAIAWTDLGGAAIAAPAGEIEAITGAIMAALGERAALATPESFEQLRIEEGIARFGADFNDQSYPQEASLERLAVSFQKGCYLGQEAVFMLEKRGHAKKRLVQITVEGEGDVPVGAEITLPEGGAAVGAVTSCAPKRDGIGVIALGHVKWKHATTGAALSVAGRPAKITKAPPSNDESAS